MYVLDTNVVSEIRKVAAGRADPNVAGWVDGVDIEVTFISVLTVYELELGIMRLEHRDPPAGAVLRRWLDDDVRAAFGGRVLAVDSAVAVRAAGLHRPRSAPVVDALIGATALVHGMTLVTRNVADFARFADLEIVDPWTPTRPQGTG